MKRALLVNISQIGDIVSSTVVADSLIQSGFDIDFLVPDFVRTLFESDTALNVLPAGEIPQGKYDVLVDLTSNKESRRIVRQVKAKRKIGRTKDFWQKCRHRVTYNTMVPKVLDGHIVRDYYPVLRALGDDQLRTPRLLPRATLPERLGLEDDARIVALHVGASNPKRLVPLSLLSQAIEWSDGNGYKVVLMGTEREIAEELVSKHRGVPLFEDLSLGEVRNVLSCSRLFIGADSGLLHIAAALGCPSVGIYGPNVPARAGPLDPSVAFFEQELGCRPCNQNVDCPWNLRCLNTLDGAQLIAMMQKQLAGVK